MRSSSVKWLREIGAPALAAASCPTQAWISSVTISWSNLPKSPMLEQPGRMINATTAKDGSFIRKRRYAHDDMKRNQSAPPHPSTAAIVRRRMRTRLGVLDMRISVTLDPDDRQNDDRCGFVLRASAAEAHNVPVIRELDNVAHQPRW